MTRGAVINTQIAGRAAAWAVLSALLLNSLWPAGFMPGARADDGAFTIVICSASGLKTVSLDASGNPVEEGAVQTDGCLYWMTAGHLLPAPQATILAAPRPGADTGPLPRDLAGLSPPATGPPLGAQAPPAFLG